MTSCKTCVDSKVPYWIECKLNPFKCEYLLNKRANTVDAYYFESHRDQKNFELLKMQGNRTIPSAGKTGTPNTYLFQKGGGHCWIQNLPWALCIVVQNCSAFRKFHEISQLSLHFWSCFRYWCFQLFVWIVVNWTCPFWSEWHLGTFSEYARGHCFPTVCLAMLWRHFQKPTL